MDLKLILLQAISGFIFWTACLSPYMLFVVKIDKKQYMKWVGMQLIIIPPLAPLSIWFANWFVWFANRFVGLF